MTENPQAGTHEREGHGGEQVVAVALDYGVDTLFTLSGAHVFPVYDGAVTAPEPLRLLDVRHEQTAVFAAEGLAKLTRRPGLAVVTAGPGVTNTVSAVTTAHFNGSPVVVLGGRAPAWRWGTGSLQEMDHVPLLAPVTRHAATVTEPDAVGAGVRAAFEAATTPHRGPAFVDVPMDVLFTRGQIDTTPQPPAPPTASEPDDGALGAAVTALRAAHRPVLVLGSDVWTGGADVAAREVAEQLGLPVITNGMGRGVLPAGHPQLVTRARSKAFKEADVVVVVGTPLDFRLGYGAFSGGAAVVHVVDAADQLAGHVELAAGLAGDLTTSLRELGRRLDGGLRPEVPAWTAELREAARSAVDADADVLASDADPVHPARIYGELNRRLADDAVVVGDGGDFVSFAGRFVEPRTPGGWMDPGPFGCLGTGPGYAIAARLARPSSQVVLLLGDGAAGFSLMDVDTMVRHRLPVVMVVGNNGVWGLEKHPMNFLYGYDVVADLAPQTRYDQVVRSLGGDGELVTRPEEIGPALDRAFASGVPYLVNVITDPAVAYPRSTTGI
ncbi:MAG TPA: acetolactate synthase [Actinomycetales bacterium]|nr:acetolactate synthase [Actinomycetales bacterium]